jgi:hypothetical protein
MTDIAISNAESPTRSPLGRALDLTAVCALVASGVVLGPGIPHAVADEDLPTAQMDNLRLDGTTAYVTFTDYTEDETGYEITMFERDNRDRIVVDATQVAAVPGTRRQATRTVSGIPSGVALCATVRSYRFGVNGPTSVDNASSYWSNDVCADPAFARSDLALQNIRGNATPQASASPAYLVEIRNPGGTNAIGIAVDISTSGVATLGDQAAVAGGWNANGFTCASRAPSGGETSALSCTGGQLKQGEQTDPAVIVSFTGPGSGAIHASISSATTDTDTGNNGTALTVNAS